jgi:hypothetical protein
MTFFHAEMTVKFEKVGLSPDDDLSSWGISASHANTSNNFARING